MVNPNLIAFTDLEGRAVVLPVSSISHWDQDREGRVRLWAMNGPPLFPMVAATLEAALTRVGLGPALAPPKPSGPLPPSPAAAKSPHGKKA